MNDVGSVGIRRSCNIHPDFGIVKTASGICVSSTKTIDGAHMEMVVI